MYRHFKKLREKELIKENSGSGRLKKLSEDHKAKIIEIIQSDNSLSLNKIAENLNKNLNKGKEVISVTAIWRFIRSKGFMSKLPIEKHVLTKFQKSARKNFESKILIEIGVM